MHGCLSPFFHEPRSETFSRSTFPHTRANMIVPLLLGAFISTSYVAVIKIAVPDHVTGHERNDPLVVQFRVRRILYLCFFLFIITPPLCVYLNGADCIKTAVRQMGLMPGFTNSHNFWSDLINVAVSFAKIAALYAGPICAYIYTEAHNWQSDCTDNFGSAQGIRDHVFAPVTEEFVYRAALAAVLKPVFLETILILYSPLLFGLAHVHHGFALYFLGNVSLFSAVLSSGFQFAYTTLFGILANTFYVKSDYNLWCPIVVHVTCNLMGFPSFEIRNTHPRFFYVYCGLLVFGTIVFWKTF